MVTRGAITRLTSVLPIGWAGRLCCWDAYPTGLGRELWRLYHEQFEKDLDRMLSVLLDEHPAGWKFLLALDQNTFDQNPQAPASAGVCLCHGEHSEPAHIVTDENAQAEGVQWAYVFTSSYADRGEGTPLQRYDTLLVLRSGRWQQPCVVDLRGLEPDWEQMEAEQGSAEVTSARHPDPATAHVCVDEGRPHLYRVQFPHEAHHYVGESRDEHGRVQTFCTCSPDEEAPSPSCPHARAVRHYREQKQKIARERQERGLRYSGAWFSTEDCGSERESQTEVLVWEGGQPRLLDPAPSQRLHNHSPSGFSWGYAGSGPAQLALAILLDYVGDEQMALAHYQTFKASHIVAWPQEGTWELGADEIEAFLLIRRAVKHSKEQP